MPGWWIPTRFSKMSLTARHTITSRLLLGVTPPVDGYNEKGSINRDACFGQSVRGIYLIRTSLWHQPLELVPDSPI